MPIRAAHLSALLLTLAAAAHAQTDTQTDIQTQPQTTPAEPAEPTAPPGQFGASGSGWLPAEGLPRWRIRFEPSAAYLAPSGDLELPSGGSIRGNSFDLEDINLDTPQLEPMGELHFSRGRTRIMIEGAGFSATQSFNLGTSAVLGAAPIGPNDPARISFEYQTFAVTGSRRLATWASGVRPDGSSEVAFGIDILAGLRFHRLDIDAEVLPVGPIPPRSPPRPGPTRSSPSPSSAPASSSTSTNASPSNGASPPAPSASATTDPSPETSPSRSPTDPTPASASRPATASSSSASSPATPPTASNGPEPSRASIGGPPSPSDHG
jgi:hypothetical protein